jgi:hypothetical protein
MTNQSLDSLEDMEELRSWMERGVLDAWENELALLVCFERPCYKGARFALLEQDFPRLSQPAKALVVAQFTLWWFSADTLDEVAWWIERRWELLGVESSFNSKILVKDLLKNVKFDGVEKDQFEVFCKTFEEKNEENLSMYWKTHNELVQRTTDCFLRQLLSLAFSYRYSSNTRLPVLSNAITLVLSEQRGLSIEEAARWCCDWIKENVPLEHFKLED